MSEDHYQEIQQLIKTQTPFVTVTLVNIQGSAPQEQGAKIIVTQKGLHAGTVGGGKIEAQAIIKAQQMLRGNFAHEFVSWNLQKDIGMTCGGVVHFFFEVHQASDWKICVFGAGHVAQSLIRLLLTLDAQITCVDEREDWLEKLPQNKKLKTVYLKNMSDYIERLPVSTYIISMTMGHAYDVPILKKAFERDVFPYVGAIGSQSKAKKLKSEIGLTANQNLICPIGLPLGKSKPAEIAVSIVAQILQHRDQK